jgi:ADP-ribose pyrophosphatase
MQKPWKLIKSEKVFDSKYIKIGKDQVLLPDGKKIDDYYTFLDCPSYVTVIPVLKNNKILMIEEWAYPVNQLLLQFPEGDMDQGETVEESARRELFEETGYSADEFKILGSCLISHRRTSSRQYVVVAYGANHHSSPELKGLEQNIVSKEVEVSEINAQIASGKIIQRNVLSAWAIFCSKN